MHCREVVGGVGRKGAKLRAKGGVGLVAPNPRYELVSRHPPWAAPQRLENRDGPAVDRDRDRLPGFHSVEQGTGVVPKFSGCDHHAPTVARLRRLWHGHGSERCGTRPGTPCRSRPRPPRRGRPADHGPPAHGLPATWPKPSRAAPDRARPAPAQHVTPSTVDLDQRTPSERRTIFRPRVPALTRSGTPDGPRFVLTAGRPHRLRQGAARLSGATVRLAFMGRALVRNAATPRPSRSLRPARPAGPAAPARPARPAAPGTARAAPRLNAQLTPPAGARDARSPPSDPGVAVAHPARPARTTPSRAPSRPCTAR